MTIARAKWILKTIERHLLSIKRLEFLEGLEKKLDAAKPIPKFVSEFLEVCYRDALWKSWGESWIEDPDEEMACP